MEIRGFGSGFCYNSGRLLTSIGPFIIGIISTQGINPLTAIQFIAFFPLAGCIAAALKVPPETR